MADARPHHGIAPFVLGMSRDAVRAAAGEPDSIESSEDDGRGLESWFYDGGSIELEFELSPQARLESVTAWSSEITLNGVRLVDAPVAELARLAEEAEIEDLELAEEFGASGSCFQSEQCGLMIWAVRGRIVNFTLFPRFDDRGEEPLWPT